MVNITLRVLSRPSVEKLPQIYQELSTDYDERILPSIVNEVLKSVVAKYNAGQLITRTNLNAEGRTAWTEITGRREVPRRHATRVHARICVYKSSCPWIQ